MHRQVKRESGVVLITVLLILMILALITNFYMRQARHQIQLASGLKHKVAACDSAQLAFQGVKSKLLTSIRSQLVGQPAHSISHNLQDKGFWNFYNQSFEYKGSTVHIQDLAGLISLGNIQGSLTSNYFQTLGISNARIRTFAQALQDWEDQDDFHRLDGAESNYYLEKGLPLPRNNKLSSIYELRMIKDYPEELDSVIAKGHITTQPQSHFNPLNAPLPILASFLKDRSLAELVDERRRSAPMKGVEFASITGTSESSYVLFAPSTNIRVKVIGKTQYARCTEDWIVNLKGNSRDSYTLHALY